MSQASSSSSSSSSSSTSEFSLFDRSTQAVFYNYKPQPIQRMLDFDHLCGRPTPSVAALITPGTTRGLQKVFHFFFFHFYYYYFNHSISFHFVSLFFIFI